MTYSCRVSVSYGDRLTKLERLRLVDALYDELRNTFGHSQNLWEKSSQSLHERRDACVAVAIALSKFALDVGVPVYVKERVNDLLVALNELQCGRRSSLLAPAPVHPSRFAVADLQQQAIAQVCVDILRQTGESAAEARKLTAAAFGKHKLLKFSESKLRAIGSRLKGPGATQDPAYDVYQWAGEQAARTRRQMRFDELNRSSALKLINTLVGLAKRRDHRHDFFFAPGEDSSAVP
jgi:hypothetical protein